MEITSYASNSSRDLASVAAESSSSASAASSAAMPSSRPVKIIPLQHPSAPSSSSSPGGGGNALFLRWKSKLKRMTWLDWIETLLPCCRWIRTYKWREYLQIDLMAGLTVGVMLVPQVIHHFSPHAEILRSDGIQFFFFFFFFLFVVSNLANPPGCRFLLFWPIEKQDRLLRAFLL